MLTKLDWAPRAQGWQDCNSGEIFQSHWRSRETVPLDHPLVPFWSCSPFLAFSKSRGQRRGVRPAEQGSGQPGREGCSPSAPLVYEAGLVLGALGVTLRPSAQAPFAGRSPPALRFFWQRGHAAQGELGLGPGELGTPGLWSGRRPKGFCQRSRRAAPERTAGTHVRGWVPLRPPGAGVVVGDIGLCWRQPSWLSRGVPGREEGCAVAIC